MSIMLCPCNSCFLSAELKCGTSFFEKWLIDVCWFSGSLSIFNALYPLSFYPYIFKGDGLAYVVPLYLCGTKPMQPSGQPCLSVGPGHGPLSLNMLQPFLMCN